ncbi:MAG: hypothetical protein FIA99_05870 [Ruminiclostridium sp.]|nr:hypothetical protein [Ruminiclostridium sp.]
MAKGIVILRTWLAITIPSILADFLFGFVVVGLDTQSICASIRLAEQKIITESDGTFITSQALIFNSWFLMQTGMRLFMKKIL